MRRATLDLWGHIYDSERGTLAVWSTGGQAQGPNGPRTKYFDYPAQAKDAAEHARKESETGREAYFCAHLLTAPQRVKGNAAPVRTLWSEYDGAEVPNGNLKPTALVESSPGRFHAYWRLTDPIPPEIAEGLNERITQATGADPSGCDLSQLLRVPGTVNHKYEDRPVVRLVGINNEHEYVPAQLHDSLPEKKKEKFTQAAPVGERIPSGRRNKDLTSIAGSMRRRGMGEAEILAALQVANERRCSPPLEVGEVARIASSVARYEPSEAGVEITHAGGKKLHNDGEVGSVSVSDGDAKPPVADRLVRYVREARWPLFVDQHAESHTLVEGEAVPISRTNRPLTKLLFKHEGKAPSNDGLIGARRVLDMLAHDSGDVRESHTRAAYHEHAVFYQLAPDRVARIDENGWSLDPNPPVYFRAVKNLQPLPSPTPGGKLEEVAEWVNLKSDRDRRLFLAYVTLATLAHIPRPILQTTGVMGSGKSTACRIVKRLLDPTGTETVTADRRDFLQKAAHCYILLLDNQNSLPEWFQDTLCRLVTGESDSKRVLYSDDEDLVWSMRRAILLNGINPPSERGDIQDRTLPIELDRLDKRKRLPEDDFWLQFSLKHPRLLGAIFDALAGALRARHTVVLAERPRLTDWGLYAAALYESQGWGVETFVEDWKGVEEAQQQGTLDGSIVAQAVILYMKDKDRVELSAAKLHAAIEDRVEDDLDLARDKTWPKTGRTLWKKIREVTPLLEVHGIRAYRKNDNRAGRPIVLDTDFDGDGPDDNNYAKYADDNADDKCVADDNADDNFGVSSADTPHTYAETDDNGQCGRYFGVSLGSHTLIKKEEVGHDGGKSTQGESKPDLSSASSATDEKTTVEEAQTNSTNSETHNPDAPVHRDPEAFEWERTY